MGLGPLALYGLQEPRAKGAGCAAPEVMLLRCAKRYAAKPRGAAQLTRPLDTFQRSPVCHQMMRPGAISTARRPSGSSIGGVASSVLSADSGRRGRPKRPTGVSSSKTETGKSLRMQTSGRIPTTHPRRGTARIAVNVAKLPEPLSRLARISGARRLEPHIRNVRG
jgi:hypothetical protein